MSVLAAAALLLAGCCERTKCGVPVAEVDVRDQAGALPPGTVVQVEGQGTERYCRNRGERCAFWVWREGTATVSAPGFKSVAVTVERKLDECGNGLSQQVQVVLAPETAAEQSVTMLGAALGCGSD